MAFIRGLAGEMSVPCNELQKVPSRVLHRGVSESTISKCVSVIYYVQGSSRGSQGQKKAGKIKRMANQKRGGVRAWLAAS